MNRAILLTLLLLLAGAVSHAQPSDRRYKPVLGFSGGLVYQRHLFASVGLLCGQAYDVNDENDKFNPPDPSGGIKLSALASLTASRLIIAPVLSYEYHFAGMSARLSAADYLQQNAARTATMHDLRITPELGIGVMGFLSLTGGFSIPLTDRRSDISRGYIGLVINTGQDWW